MSPDPNVARVLARAVAVCADPASSDADLSFALAELAWAHEQEREAVIAAIRLRRFERFLWGERAVAA